MTPIDDLPSRWDGPADLAHDTHDINRLLARHGELEQKRRQLAAYVTEERQLLTRYELTQAAPLEDEMDQIEHTLEQWARKVNAAEPKQLTWSLPHGTMRLREPQRSVVIDDADEFVEWARSNDRLDLLTVAPSKSAIKDARFAVKLVGTAPREGDTTLVTTECLVDQSSGERIPGVSLIAPAERSFSATTTATRKRDNEPDADTATAEQP